MSCFAKNYTELNKVFLDLHLFTSNNAQIISLTGSWGAMKNNLNNYYCGFTLVNNGAIFLQEQLTTGS